MNLCKSIFSYGLIVGCHLAAHATTPTVPSTMRFADMQLKITAKARKKIQADVDRLTNNPQYFQTLLDRANLFFPIIEKNLKKEAVPQDFKYQVIQESALISDAISKSNAVGFWQFKAFSAAEVGLQMNRHVDERMDIVAATRGAARYLKTNNEYFNNWLYSLMAYLTGRGGAQRLTHKKYYGAKHMTVDHKTHWYVLRFLAYKVAFEKLAGKGKHPELALYPYKDAHGKTLQQVAKKFEVEAVLLRQYNRWLKYDKAPHQKHHTVIVPLTHRQHTRLYKNNSTFTEIEIDTLRQSIALPSTGADTLTYLADLNKAAVDTLPPALSNTTIKKLPPNAKLTTDYTYYLQAAENFPKITQGKFSKTKINALHGIIANEADDLSSLANKGAMALEAFLQYNDIDANHKVCVGQAYYFKRKKNRTTVLYHVVQPEESLWCIAQKYGIKKKKLLQKNRLQAEMKIIPGRVLWLRFIRPAEAPVVYQELPGDTTEDMLVPNAVVAAPQDTVMNRMPTQQVSDDSNRLVEAHTETPPATHAEAHNQSSSATTTHIVQPGETLYAIARKYQLGIADLRLMNHLQANDALRIGQPLVVTSEHADTDSQPCEEHNLWHTVKPGDTLCSIAQRYQVTVQEIINWNTLPCTDIKIGDRLKIKE